MVNSLIFERELEIMGALTLIILAIGSLIIFQSHRQQKKIKWFTEKVDLTGRIAVVTGGSSGLGLSSAIQELIASKCIGSLADRKDILL